MIAGMGGWSGCFVCGDFVCVTGWEVLSDGSRCMGGGEANGEASGMC